MVTASKQVFSSRFPFLFLGTAVLLMGLYNFLPSTIIENGIVRYFAVIPSGAILDWITPGLQIKTEGTRILSSVANLNVLKGCEGTETLLLLYAGILALLRPLKLTVPGILLGTALVFVLNQVRIVILFFVVAYQKSYFELIHGFLAPLLIIAIVGIFFFYWSNSASVSSHTQ